MDLFHFNEMKRVSPKTKAKQFHTGMLVLNA